MKVLSLSLFFILGILFKGYAQSNVYSFSIDSVLGSNHIDFSAFSGKKILVVNIASADADTAQFRALETLYQLYKDSLVIVGVSSNSFNDEPKSNGEIASYYAAAYNFHFPVSSLIAVTGTDAHPLYQWLTSKIKNGLLNSQVRGNFNKYLINREGELRGVFNRKTKPMSATFRHYIEIL